jgi:hypothetical protein
VQSLATIRKLLILLSIKWWPETGSNRRRRPFQGCRTMQLNGLESADIFESE